MLKPVVTGIVSGSHFIRLLQFRSDANQTAPNQTAPCPVGCRAKPALQDFRCQRNYFHEPLGTKLTRHRPENTGADRLKFLVQNDSRILIETY